MNQRKVSDQRGVIAILALMAVTVFGVAMIMTVNISAVNEVRDAANTTATEKTFSAAESGINEALYRLIKNPGLNNPVLPCYEHPDIACFELTSAETGVESIKVYITTNGFQRTIKSVATDKSAETDPSRKVRTLQINAKTTTFAGGFEFAALGGAGGVIMGKSSRIEGEDSGKLAIHSNTNLAATDDATGGNAPEIKGQAHYNSSVDTDIKTNGAECPNSDCTLVSEQRDIPFSDSEDVLRLTAPLTSLPPALDPCYDYTDPNTDYITCDTELGGQTIPKSVYIKNGVTLTLTGSLYITGQLEFEDRSIVQISSDVTLQGKSLAIISDNTINVGKNVDILGRAGDAKSFILLLASNSDIIILKGANSLIVAAPYGTLTVGDDVAADTTSVSAAAAYVLQIMKKDEVKYNANIGGMVISPPSGKSIVTTQHDWQEL